MNQQSNISGNIKAIKMPPLNLLSIQEWYLLLFNYPLLASVEDNDKVNAVAMMYYKT